MVWKISNVIRSRWSLGRRGVLFCYTCCEKNTQNTTKPILWFYSKNIPIGFHFSKMRYREEIKHRKCNRGQVYEIYLDYNQSQELWNIYRHIKRVYIFRIEYDLSFWLQKLIKPAVVPENFPPENGPGFNPLTEKRAGIECPSRNIPV